MYRVVLLYIYCIILFCIDCVCPVRLVDLPSIMGWYHAGRYSDGNGLGITLLLNDIEQMISHGLQYNQCNQFFLPYRLCEALHKWNKWFTGQLLKYHGSKCLKVYADSMGIQTQTKSTAASTSKGTAGTTAAASVVSSSCKVVVVSPPPKPKCSMAIVKKVDRMAENSVEEEVHSQFIEM